MKASVDDPEQKHGPYDLLVGDGVIEHGFPHHFAFRPGPLRVARQRDENIERQEDGIESRGKEHVAGC